MATKLQPHGPSQLLPAGGYRVTRSSGPSKKQSRRTVSPAQHAGLGGGGVGRRGAKPAGKIG